MISLSILYCPGPRVLSIVLFLFLGVSDPKGAYPGFCPDLDSGRYSPGPTIEPRGSFLSRSLSSKGKKLMIDY